MTLRAARPPLTLASSVQYLRGAGPALGKKLATLGIRRVEDLLFHLPYRYEDRRRFTPLASVRDGEAALVRAEVQQATVKFPGRRALEVTLREGDGGLRLRFFHFNQAQAQRFTQGAWVRAYGTVRFGRQGPELVHPEYRIAAARDALAPEPTLTPCYPLTAGISQPRLRDLIRQAFSVATRDPAFTLALPGLEPPETLDALRTLHLPDGDADALPLQAGTHPAQARLVTEELLAHQLCMRALRRRVRRAQAIECPLPDAQRRAFVRALPFKPTDAQRRVLGEVVADLEARRPMMRLVQGDVGSGKTVVAAAALFAAAQAGRQAVLMAPTELLAQQHADNLSRWLDPLGVGLALLKGGLRAPQRRAALAAIAEGTAQVVIGTHAVFQQGVDFADLALVVIDEQHRFGVQQRLALRDKTGEGAVPHQLVMTATPIPRTLAQTVYADLDVSVIDELPPARLPVNTVAIGMPRREEVLKRIGAACRDGRQAYWVCTLIEASEALEAKAAEEAAEQLRAELPDVRVGLVHGRMKPAGKAAQMAAFQRGETQLLVATTVIEVGVDVSNASIIIIENAERLGLAQLHQLRGRVGRGTAKSQCVLLFQPPLGETARARLDVLRRTHDGFEIAQEDLQLRGPGELLGRRQTGEVGLKVADPVRDAHRVPPLQALADQWLDSGEPAAARLVRRWVGDWQSYADV